MSDRCEDGEAERLRAEVAALRDRLYRLECAGAPAGDRCDCPDCRHDPHGCPDCRRDPYEMPLLNPFSLSLLVLALASLAFFTTVALLG